MAPFRHRHQLAIEGPSPADINHVLDLADGHAETQPDAQMMHPGRGRGIETGGEIADNCDHPASGPDRDGVAVRMASFEMLTRSSATTLSRERRR